jgi:hypothetical protein
MDGFEVVEFIPAFHGQTYLSGRNLGVHFLLSMRNREVNTEEYGKEYSGNRRKSLNSEFFALISQKNKKSVDRE